MRLGDREIGLAQPIVMAILNITPDSFYGESRKESSDDIERAIVAAELEGASIIDVGGYSSRPGAEDVSPEQEWARVERGIAAVRKVAPKMAVSVDTFRASVARKALDKFGPCIINDISAGDLDPEIVDVVAQNRVPYIAMHMRGTPSNMQNYAQYGDITAEVVAFFRAKIEQLRAKGVEDIIIDPGFGFAKDTRQNYQLLQTMERLTEFGPPILVGFSRKSMIYKVLGTTPENSLVGTAALNWEALGRGAKILRVHDTQAACDVVRLHNYYSEKI